MPAPSIIVESSLDTITFLDIPRSSTFTASNESPNSSEMTVVFVKIAISSKIAFLLSPKPGPLTAHDLTTPLILLTTKVAKASPSKSSTIINNGLPLLATFSNTGIISLILLIFLSTIKIYGFSNSHVMFL